MELNVGAFAPSPDTKDFSRKVSWNFKSFAQNNVVFFERSSPLHLSTKERCVLLPTFLIRKVGYSPATLISFTRTEGAPKTVVPPEHNQLFSSLLLSVR